MRLKSQVKLILTSLIVLLLIPLLLYFFAGEEVKQFMRDFSSYFAVVITIVGIYLLMLTYIKQTKLHAHEANKQLNRGYLYIDQKSTRLNYSHVANSYVVICMK